MEDARGARRRAHALSCKESVVGAKADRRAGAHRGERSRAASTASTTTSRSRSPRLVPHRTLALNRAEREDVVRVAVEVPFERAEPLIQRVYRPDPASPFAGELSDGHCRRLQAAAGAGAGARDARRADAAGGGTRHHRLRRQPAQAAAAATAAGRRVLGLDPGFRTGCKVAIVDETGIHLESTTIYPHAPQQRWDEAKATLKALIANTSDIGASPSATARPRARPSNSPRR